MTCSRNPTPPRSPLHPAVRAARPSTLDDLVRAAVHTAIDDSQARARALVDEGIEPDSLFGGE